MLLALAKPALASAAPVADAECNCGGAKRGVVIGGGFGFSLWARAGEEPH